ncbi:MAG: response regulator [Cyanobacteria bacterium P01_A01_bin.105]
MQGELSELDIRSILQLIELGQRTGELYVSARGLPSTTMAGFAPTEVAWLAFFDKGQLVYAGPIHGQLDRLQDHLRGQGIQTDITVEKMSDLAPFNAPEYGMVWTLLERRLLTPQQGRSILGRLIAETLFELLSLHQGTFVFRRGCALSPQLTTLAITPLLTQVTQQLQDWHQLQPRLQSLRHRPQVVDTPHTGQAQQQIKRLATWADGHTPLIQIARYLNRDSLAVAKALHPYVKQGIVQMMPPLEPEEPFSVSPTAPIDSVPRIVCIDDGMTIRQTVEDILNRHGYEVTSIANPLKALSLLFQLKPDLILCDIAMPQLEGYELCAMVRQAAAFRETPIIMLTGKAGFIDRIRARIAGATDYLTKPFGELELVALVERYVGQGDPLRSRPDHLLEEEIADVL